MAKAKTKRRADEYICGCNNTRSIGDHGCQSYIWNIDVHRIDRSHLWRFLQDEPWTRELLELNPLLSIDENRLLMIRHLHLNGATTKFIEQLAVGEGIVWPSPTTPTYDWQAP